jgi:ABC-2 type transport system permease protein
VRKILAISGKEARSYFASPIAYVVMAMFLLITGYFFAAYVGNTGLAMLDGLFSTGTIIMLMLVASLLTMRLLAEEQKLGTIELLLTAPVRDWEVVIGKYLASLAVFVVMVGLTLYYPLLLFWFGDPDPGPIFSGYVGLFLLGASFLSVGLLASSLTSNQIVSAVLAFGLLILVWVMAGAGGFVSGAPAEVISYMSLSFHLGDFVKGVIDTKDIIYYLSFIALFLFLAVRSLETRRWR